MDIDQRLRVMLTRIELPQSFVISMVRLSHAVARWNGNTSWCTPLRLVTDDVDMAYRSLDPADQRHERRATKRFSENAGVTWPNSGVIWVSGAVPHYFVAQLLAHEVAHVLATGTHGERWRRMYALLFPLWHDAIHGTNVGPYAVPPLGDYATFNECRRVIDVYALYRTAERAGVEMRRLHDMTDRSRTRWGNEVNRVVSTIKDLKT